MNIITFSFSFSFVFCTAQAMQQHITTNHFHEHVDNIGHLSLILIYVFYFFGSLVAPKIVQILRLRGSFMVAGFFYSLFLLTPLLNNEFLILFLSSSLGMAASVLWVSFYTYINSSYVSTRGKNSGLFWSIEAFCAGIVMASFGFFAENRGIEFTVFVIFFISVVGIMGLYRTDNTKQVTIKSKNWFPLIKSSTCLKISFLSLCNDLVYGIMISYVPVKIYTYVGTMYVGLLSSPFFVVPALSSFYFGKLSDMYGRVRLTFFGISLSIISCVILIFENNIIDLFFGVIIFTFSYSVLSPIIATIPGDISPDGFVERVSGTLTLFSSIGILIGILLSYKVEQKIAFCILIFVLLLGLYFVASLPKALSLKKIVEEETQI